MVFARAAATAMMMLISAASMCSAGPADESPFYAENDAAMNRMMDAMTIKPTGDVDRDFTAMMIPHHQGAIDMAVAYLRYGHNEQLRRIAQEIIVEQRQEIDAMRLAVGLPPSPAAAAPTQPSGDTAMQATMGGAMHHHDQIQKDR
jgi:uncharacterized protein (DUF305 family)